jgi:hypothetical protein
MPIYMCISRELAIDDLEAAGASWVGNIEAAAVAAPGAKGGMTVAAHGATWSINSAREIRIGPRSALGCRPELKIGISFLTLSSIMCSSCRAMRAMIGGIATAALLAQPSARDALNINSSRSNYSLEMAIQKNLYRVVTAVGCFCLNSGRGV